MSEAKFMKETLSVNNLINSLQLSIETGTNPAADCLKINVLDTIPQASCHKTDHLNRVIEKDGEHFKEKKKEQTSVDPDVNGGYAYVVLLSAVLLLSLIHI